MCHTVAVFLNFFFSIQTYGKKIVHWLSKSMKVKRAQKTPVDGVTRKIIFTFHYMASSVSGQDEPNRALWLATRAGKMEQSCPLGTTRCIPQAKFRQKPYNKSFIDQVWGQDGWILASFFFCEFMDLDFVSVHKHAKKELGHLTSHLVNNPYVFGE